MKRLILVLCLVLVASFAFAENNKWTRPPMKQIVVTPSDATIYSPPLVSVWNNTAGDVRFILVQDTFTCANAPIHLAVPAGLVRGRVKQVCATGTASTNIIGYVAVK